MLCSNLWNSLSVFSNFLTFERKQLIDTLPSRKYVIKAVKRTLAPLCNSSHVFYSFYQMLTVYCISFKTKEKLNISCFMVESKGVLMYSLSDVTNYFHVCFHAWPATEINLWRQIKNWAGPFWLHHETNGASYFACFDAFEKSTFRGKRKKKGANALKSASMHFRGKLFWGYAHFHIWPRRHSRYQGRMQALRLASLVHGWLIRHLLDSAHFEEMNI